MEFVSIFLFLTSQKWLKPTFCMSTAYYLIAWFFCKEIIETEYFPFLGDLNDGEMPEIHEEGSKIKSKQSGNMVNTGGDMVRCQMSGHTTRVRYSSLFAQ